MTTRSNRHIASLRLGAHVIGERGDLCAPPGGRQAGAATLVRWGQRCAQLAPTQIDGIEATDCMSNTPWVALAPTHKADTCSSARG